MAEKKLDLRVAKTYDALFAALRDLLREKPFEQISVTELCDRARTRRATFYKHFGDKYEFLMFMVRETRHRFVELALGRIEGLEGREATEALVRHGLGFVEQNEDLLRAFQRNNLLPSLLDMSQIEWGDVSRVAAKLVPSGSLGSPQTVRGELRLKFAQGALAMSAIWWLDRKGEVDKEIAVAEIVGLLQRL